MPAGSKKPSEPEIRDLLLENMAGNYFIAQYQSSRLMEHFHKTIQETKPDENGKKKLKSSHTFKFEGKYYKMVVSIREVGLDELMKKD